MVGKQHINQAVRRISIFGIEPTEVMLETQTNMLHSCGVGEISSDNPFKVQYAICCERDGNITWDNNDGNNYFFQQAQLKVLILNLHCYQEENQDEKFTLIAKVINELKIDVICFQEVAEYWRDGEGDWESNSAKLD